MSAQLIFSRSLDILELSTITLTKSNFFAPTTGIISSQTGTTPIVQIPAQASDILVNSVFTMTNNSAAVGFADMTLSIGWPYIAPYSLNIAPTANQWQASGITVIRSGVFLAGVGSIIPTQRRRMVVMGPNASILKPKLENSSAIALNTSGQTWQFVAAPNTGSTSDFATDCLLPDSCMPMVQFGGGNVDLFMNDPNSTLQMRLTFYAITITG